jgi:fermentation-respiration switch protein FrsA (DUF1100 family)
LAGLAAALLAGACSGSAGSKPAATSAPPTSTAAVSPSGTNVAIGFRQESFVDTSRPTPADNGRPGAPTRTLSTLVFYPAVGPAGSAAGEDAPLARTGGPYPLVVFAHGLGGFPAAYGALLTTWAHAGFIVAAPTFPLTHFGAAGGLVIADYNSQPGDVRFVITQLLRLNTDPTSMYAGAIDPAHVAVAGHSLGAMTVLGLLNTCCRDPRISAAIVLAGEELVFGTGDRFFAGPATPVLFVHGTKDELVSYPLGVKAFSDATAPKFLVTLPGADHIVPYLGSAAQPTAQVVQSVTTDFLDHYEKGDAGALGSLDRDANVAGVATLQASP